MDHDRRNCPKFEAAMEVLGRPWTGLVIASLEDGPLRFRELGERVGAIGDRMLSLRLRELEARGLVERRVCPGPPIRVEYALTPAGCGFRQVAEAVSRWGGVILEAKANAPASDAADEAEPALPTRQPA
jgi:DNA-binding HxlR family transcriptional regulator